MAIDSETLDDPSTVEVLDYLEMAAHSLVNSRLMDQRQRPDQAGSPRASARRRADPMGEPWWSQCSTSLSPIVRRLATATGWATWTVEAKAPTTCNSSVSTRSGSTGHRLMMADHGYDRRSRDIDPLFGRMPAFRLVVAAAHRQGIKVTGVVPNHPVQRTHGFRPRWLTSQVARRWDHISFAAGGAPDGSLHRRTTGSRCSAGRPERSARTGRRASGTFSDTEQRT